MVSFLIALHGLTSARLNMTSAANDTASITALFSILSAIIGALIGGIFLLVGQRVQVQKDCKMAAKIIFTGLYRQAGTINNAIITILECVPNTSYPVFPLFISLNQYFDLEKELIQCVDISTINAMYLNAQKIYRWQKRLFVDKRIDDADVSYTMLCETQKHLLDMLDTLMTIIKFDSDTEKNKLSRVTALFRETIDKFDQKPRTFRFSLLFPPDKTIESDRTWIS